MTLTIEKHLRTLVETYGQTTVKDAMSYSLLSGGKRIRPRLVLTLLHDLGGTPEKGMDAACAIEMIHTYSLVHDDLPAMDNDDFRRFKPTNHKVYGEGMAILAGDGLLTGAFTTIANAPLDALEKAQCIEILARNAGALGMILGQELDIDDNISNIDGLIRCYELKTGCLFSAALEMATVIAGRQDLQSIAFELGQRLGVAFQFQDDLLEATKSSEEIGKSSQSDTDRSKATIVSILGLIQAQKVTAELFIKIKSLLDQLPLTDTQLEALIAEMVDRNL
ncbi:polyprenyl synthetase family protein [Erysipelothrix sp. HDW6C]|uniref:polyprenyl synthetase family protein n=1 Tax=Erysipelothrix sp. HDW6C TaxID=2714930 RepID=UPI00140BF250|nr:farnesyl diphosphate synthase [Erysipelothrix sp. HDW6C]QIK70056.1 polyprenyl synthetase family protein [Erysipelothrix sp. HDW6C]